MDVKALFLVSAMLAFGSAGVAGAADLHEVAVPALKRAYLECERRALTDTLSTGQIAECSIVYERLKERAFEGDWKRLREWTIVNLNAGQDD